MEAKDKNAASGRYEIALLELRIATEDDRTLYEALKLNTEFLRLYFAGRYDEACPLAERVLEIRERVLGPEHRDVAASLTVLAHIHFLRGEYAKAEPLYGRALAIIEKVLEPEHPKVGISFNHLASLYRVIGDSAKAGPLYQRANGIFEKALGPDHTDVAASLTSLAILYKFLGNYAKAEPLYKRALDIREKAFGPDHVSFAEALFYLSLLYAAKGDLSQAIRFLSRANDVDERNMEHTLALGSERQKLDYLSIFSQRTDYTLSLHSQAASAVAYAAGKQEPAASVLLGGIHPIGRMGEPGWPTMKFEIYPVRARKLFRRRLPLTDHNHRSCPYISIDTLVWRCAEHIELL